jgi:hypothetical protein
MTKDEGLRLAIESLCCVRDMVGHPDNLEYIDHQVAKIEAALEANDELVAWMHIQGNHKEPSLRQLDDWEIQNGWKQYPLYTTSSQRKPLTVEEIAKLDCYDNFKLARRIEAAHGIK